MYESWLVVSSDMCSAPIYSMWQMSASTPRSEIHRICFLHSNGKVTSLLNTGKEYLLLLHKIFQLLQYFFLTFFLFQRIKSTEHTKEHTINTVSIRLSIRITKFNWMCWCSKGYHSIYQYTRVQMKSYQLWKNLRIHGKLACLHFYNTNGHSGYCRFIKQLWTLKNGI